ncbi:2Fe-2S iron-sulfur cluster binding domain-containing protein [Pseudoduganella sp. OTU4001]|uniref:2Fe-2S iron-sulfur cluster binding domain-containing protein n=1 Tax=Pseudoduganella sp. OTU4001 TaxID=3043854 RepID=UPI00313B510B
MNTTDFQLSIAGESPIRSAPGETLLKSALRQGVKLPHLCMAGECGSCRCQLVQGQVKLRKDISQHVDADALRQGFLLACQAEPLSDVQLAVAARSAIGATLRSAVPLNRSILRVVLQLDEPLAYRAGQYAQLTLAGVADEPRCYSFAAAPQATPQREVEFHIRRVAGGAFTEWLFDGDRRGTRLQLLGPLGDFGARDDGRPLVCVAGGSGLAPIKGMLEQLAQQGGAPDATLFIGARNQQELYGQDFLAALQAKWPSLGTLRVVPVLSAEPADSGWQGLRGYCADYIERFCAPQACSFYLCGPPAMIEATAAHVAAQVDQNHIHYDLFLDRSNLKPEQP